MPAGVVTKDRGMVAIAKRLRELDGLQVKVGVLESAGVHASPGDGGQPLTVATIAATHEFGAGSVPERSFLRAGLDESRQTVGDAIETLTGKVIDGMSPTVAAGRLGLLGVREVQRKITKGPFQPNAPATIREKGSSRPLIDTGQLRRSITHEVVPATGATGVQVVPDGGGS